MRRDDALKIELTLANNSAHNEKMNFAFKDFVKDFDQPETKSNIWLVNLFCCFLIVSICFYFDSCLYLIPLPVIYLVSLPRYFKKHPRKTAELERIELDNKVKAEEMPATNSADIANGSKKLSSATILNLLCVHNVVVSFIFENNVDVNGLLFSAAGLSHPSLTRRLTYTLRFAC